MKSFKQLINEVALPNKLLPKVEPRTLKAGETVWHEIKNHTITFEGEVLHQTTWTATEASPNKNLARLYRSKDGKKMAWFAQTHDAKNKSKAYLILNPNDLVRNSIK